MKSIKSNAKLTFFLMRIQKFWKEQMVDFKELGLQGEWEKGDMQWTLKKFKKINLKFVYSGNCT